MIPLLLLRRCLNRILTTCRLRQCDMKNRPHSTLKQLVAFKTTINYLNYGCFYPATTVERGYVANFNKYEPEHWAFDWFEYVEWIVFVTCIWWGGQYAALSVFPLVNWWVGKCNKRELSPPSIMGAWIVWQNHSTEVFAKRKWYENRVRSLLGSGFDAMKTWEEWKRKRL